MATENKRYSINEVLKNRSLLSENYYGFYDWFCKESSLENKSDKLLTKLKFLVEQGIIDGDKNYVWFKNNCPCMGTLYDDIRISTISDNTFIGGIAPSLGFTAQKGECNVWSLVYNDEEAKENEIAERSFKSWSEFKEAIKTDPEVKKLMIKFFSYNEEEKEGE